MQTDCARFHRTLDFIGRNAFFGGILNDACLHFWERQPSLRKDRAPGGVQGVELIAIVSLIE